MNTVIFRSSSVFTHDRTQYAAYYDATGRLVLAKRSLDSTQWQSRVTPYVGKVADAHDAISIAVDGAGVLHVAWDEHGKPLRYARAVRPGSLELGPIRPITGKREERVTYPQFYRLRNGDLLFLYRDGASGAGDVLLDRYDVRRGTWRVVAHPLIDGEGERNAYVNSLAIDDRGGWHLSWCWRETPDVATNHDVVYAYSPDEGGHWKRSTGENYTLPITARTGEIARRVSRGMELINQTSMTVSPARRPIIATYWREDGSDVPQLRLVWNDGDAWRTTTVANRTSAFRLSGGGTKRIPLSRPLVLAGVCGELYVVFRDEERGGGISLAISSDSARSVWRVETLYAPSVGQWEPTYDPALWQASHRLHLFVQRVGQGDGETMEDVAPQTVSILEWSPPAVRCAASR